jgi:hypothetical protein
MGVYLVMVPDSKIAKQTTGMKSVVIAGCLACANDSLGYDKDYPLAKIAVDKDTGKAAEMPASVVAEANRLKELLESKGVSAEIQMRFGMCILPHDRESSMAELVDRCSKADAIITLCCPGGTLGLKKCLTQAARIVPGMKAEGIIQISKTLDEAGGLVYVDKDQSTTIPLLKEK